LKAFLCSIKSAIPFNIEHIATKKDARCFTNGSSDQQYGSFQVHIPHIVQDFITYYPGVHTRRLSMTVQGAIPALVYSIRGKDQLSPTIIDL
jgi:hypothetical protein